MLSQIKNTQSFIRNKIGEFTPEVGIVLGSGLGGLIDEMRVIHTLDYKDIEGFPVSTVAGHKGRLVFGVLGGKQVVAMQGRFHYYEGYTPQQVTFPIRIMKLLGIKYLLLSNAAGGANIDFSTGDLMVITDHINFIPNPLIGKNIDEFGVRFPDMSEAYTKSLIDCADGIAKNLNITLRHGCYVGLTGPSYETNAEYRFVRTIGGDAVGMSTTPEVIVAAHCGIPVFAMSIITNIGGAGNKATHEEVQAESAKAAKKMTAIFTKLIEIF